jgi:acetyl-CoA carboxylase biotin carboxylase subunit
VDTHLFSGYTVPRYYDSLLAKVIARGRDRDEAIQRLASALEEFATEGVKTTARVCARIIRSDRFRRGDLGPDLIEQFVPKSR